MLYILYSIYCIYIVFYISYYILYLYYILYIIYYTYILRYDALDTVESYCIPSFPGTWRVYLMEIAR